MSDDTNTGGSEPSLPVIDRIHAGDRETILDAIYHQEKQLKQQEIDGEVTCPCGSTGLIETAYLCFHCGIHFCPRCAKVHFGDNPSETDALSTTDSERGGDAR